MTAPLPPVLDVTAGGRMMWFDKNDPRCLFTDIRTVESADMCDGRSFEISPDMVADFRDLPFPDESFQLVVFDPPHLTRAGDTSWLAQKYGVLLPSWREDLTEGFKECFRVLKPGGVLIFKWSEVQIPLSEILELTDTLPLFGHRTQRNKRANRGGTHWVAFMKAGDAL